MPVYHPNTRFSDCWGSAGDVTFYHRDGVCYWRSKDRHSFSGSSAQVKALEVHRRALDCWKTIPDGIKEKWNGFASVVEPHKPPFDGSSHITGHNLFVSAYHGFAILGNEHVPEPVPFVRFPMFDVKVIDARRAKGCVILRGRLWLNRTSRRSTGRHTSPATIYSYLPITVSQFLGMSIFLSRCRLSGFPYLMSR